MTNEAGRALLGLAGVLVALFGVPVLQAACDMWRARRGGN